MKTQTYETPACWSWPIPEPRTLDEAVELKLARCETRDGVGSWSRDAIAFILEGDESLGRWEEFHDGRCAMCGVPCGYLVQDHCHATGQIRGLLCRGCNVREGKSNAPIVVRYRRLHPAALLDTHAMYDGRDWRDGYWIGDVGYDGWVPRPPTTWPAWSKDDAF